MIHGLSWSDLYLLITMARVIFIFLLLLSKSSYGRHAAIAAAADAAAVTAAFFIIYFWEVGYNSQSLGLKELEGGKERRFSYLFYIDVISFTADVAEHIILFSIFTI